NDVDLRWRASRALRLETRLTTDDLVVRLLGRGADPALAPGAAGGLSANEAARTCATCDEADCHLHEPVAARRAPPGRRVFLVDEAWPEFAAFVGSERRDGDRLALPLDGARRGLARYAWTGDGFSERLEAPLAALARSHAIRRAGPQGARRRQAELAGTAAIARGLARRLAPEDVELTVAQSCLPTLWRDGVLGGRSFDVLMTRLPMAVLQARLDVAAAVHPERRTLADFRASPGLADIEAEALAAARRIVTPHAEIAALFGERAVRLAWARPDGRPARSAAASRRIAFPGPTIARKGAWAVREAAQALDLEVLLLGGDLEGPGFWDGVRTVRPGAHAWTDGVAAVVQPALVEDQPRRLLQALAAGVPVLASPACGLDDPAVTLVPPDDAAALVGALRPLVG
ncbi:MAG TPA: hypothetical protein VG939_01335, partial [Caulobacteraceae bacterium]|nr:hypothetical protein [Caulobacteraceae bacterium]